MKLLNDTILRRIIETTINEWKKKVPDVKLEEYQDWQDDLVSRLMTFMEDKQSLPNQSKEEESKK